MPLWVKLSSFLATLLEHFVASSFISITLFHELVVNIWQASREDPDVAKAGFFFGF